MERIIAAILIGIVLVLLGVFVLVRYRAAVKNGDQKEKEHPCGSCHRWGECNGVDEECPLLLAYEEAMRAAANKDYYRGRHRVKKRGGGDG